MSPAPTRSDAVRVLVVDDEDAIRNALARFLAKRGFEVQTAGTGEEALKLLQKDQIALMLLDVRMPGLSGMDVVPEALHLNQDLAIVMLSAVADATSAAICMQRGALDYLTKPIELTDLVAPPSAAARSASRSRRASTAAGPEAIPASWRDFKAR